MTDFLKADIFFFVATIATIVLAILVIIALVYFIRILKNVDDISETAKEEAHKLAGDIEGLRHGAHHGAASVKHFFDFLGSLVGFRKPPSAKKEK